jgi:hypothetical protein
MVDGIKLVIILSHCAERGGGSRHAVVETIGDDRHLIHGQNPDSEEVVPDRCREAAEKKTLKKRILYTVRRLHRPHIL